MTTPMITLRRAQSLLAQAVTTQGRGFVYSPNGGASDCYYLPVTPHNHEAEEEDCDEGFCDGIAEDDPRSKTGCLVGVALTLGGIRGFNYDDGSVTALQEKNPHWMTPFVAEYFQVAQTCQDAGRSWGEAYDSAEGFLRGRLNG